ncbi:class I adenylate-forming enzyme family protein [Flavobacterium jumunjinense]|uniref:Class I adenylate-forming enzyme family protein n=2 Tax=Flavobacteriaceae TaxID=49546 RepID=A0ABV5GS23_9FLAO
MKFRLIMKIVGVKNVLRLVVSINKHGFNLLSLLDFVKHSPLTDAYIEDDSVKLSYKELYEESVVLAHYLETKYNLKAKSKVAIISSNSVAMVKTLFAVSSLGADIVLLNPNQKKDYYTSIFEKSTFLLIIGENKNEWQDVNLPFFNENEIIATSVLKRKAKRKSGSIIIFSSGTKGKPKKEKRKLAVAKYINPVIDIIQKLNLIATKTVLISVPVFHGYGLAALFLSLFLKKKIRLTRKFDAKETLQILEQENINCWIVVPLMIQKVYAIRNLQTSALKSIISGGDILPVRVVKNIHETSNIAIYNMYGTSETGVCIIATNDDLKKYPNTIGKSILGVKMKVKDTKGKSINNEDIGQLVVKCEWASDDKKDDFYTTGDLVSKNEEGYYFYRGRIDDLIVLGGENIYPNEIESMIYRNSKVKWVKARGSRENGMVGIHLDLLVEDRISFNEMEFQNWMTQEMPKYMIPKSIKVVDYEPDLKLM